MTFVCTGKNNEERRYSKTLDKKMAEWNKEYRHAIKLLLLGTGESGKTTIIKQMKILHISGFSDSERLEKVQEIRGNVHEAIYDLVSHLTVLSPPIDLDDDESETSALQILSLGPEPPLMYSKDYFDHAERLWSDLGIQECYRRSNEFQLIDSAKYFLDRVSVLSQPDYIPDDQDILHCRTRTTGIQKIEFSVKVPRKYGGGGTQEFWMFDVGGQRGERRKWIQVFEGIQTILFLAASSDFDQVLREDSNVNRLQESLQLFDDVWNSRFLNDSGFIVFLNKQDVLKEKVNQGKNIKKFFPDYSNYELKSKDGNPFDEYLRMRCFIRDMFIKITKTRRVKEDDRRFSGIAGLPIENGGRNRECYFHFTTATDTNNIKTVFEDVHSMVVTWNLAKTGLH